LESKLTAKKVKAEEVTKANKQRRKKKEERRKNENEEERRSPVLRRLSDLYDCSV
jgi:hypothetical protein